MSILIKYVNDVLTPTDEQIRFINVKIKSIKNTLMQNISIKPKEIHLGGFFIKNTMLKYKLDTDLIFVYNKNEEVGYNWQKLTNIIYKSLKSNFPEIKVEEAGNLAIHLKTTFNKTPVNFDIVPCYYVNSPIMMINHINSNLYKGITTIWHSRYITRYKDLRYYTHVVRLLKDWKNEHNVPLKCFHLELITADLYNFYDKNNYQLENIDDILYNCFIIIINTLNGFPLVPGNWRYCKPWHYEKQYDSPVLIDPANPKDNLLNKHSKEEINNIKKKTNKAIWNLNNNYYNEIFNIKGLTNFNFG